MKILVCYPWLSLGGAPNTSITLARGLKNLGHDVYFFTKSDKIHETRLQEAGIKTIAAPYHPLLPSMDLLNVKAYKILNAALNRYSIDIVHAFHHHSYLLSLFAAPRMNIPVVFTAVWFLFTKPFPAYPGRVIFVAEEFLDQATPLFRGYPREMIVLPNRIDLDEFYPGIDYRDFSKEKDLPDSGWKIAFMSRIDSIKIRSLQNAIEAVKILASRGRDVVLGIAGDGALFHELEKIIDSVNRDLGRKVIRLLGPVLKPSQFLSWSDIVLGIGRSAIEGMACGKPTLIVGEKGLAGIVEPENVKELQYHNFAGRNVKDAVEPQRLADTIDLIMNDEPRREFLSNFTRQYAIEYYDYMVGAKRLEKVYEDALNDPPLSRTERVRLLWTNATYGYGWRYYVAWRLKLRSLLGRDVSKISPNSNA